MSKKLKFKPVISRVKLNPEQAVLACEGYKYGYQSYGAEDAFYFGCATGGLREMWWRAEIWGIGSVS